MSKGTLLLVDDDRQVLASMADWLRGQGYDVDTAQNCQRARSAFAHRAYDVALLDVRLPDGDGFAFVKTLDRGDWVGAGGTVMRIRP